MSAAAKTIRYRGPKTLDHIERLKRQKIEKLLADIRCDADDPKDADLFGLYVEEELLRRYDRGVFSLAERPNCPLMWSHYGDQHRGLCLGYSIPAGAAGDLHKIKYGGGRSVEASAVAAMLNGDIGARRRVDEAVLLTKTQEWRYEKEWRLLGPRGLQNSRLELEEVVFGMRCSLSVKYAVMKALEDRVRPVKLYEIGEKYGSFKLDKREFDGEFQTAGYPVRNRIMYEALESYEELTAEEGRVRGNGCVNEAPISLG